MTLKKRRGLSEIVGGVFIIIIISTAIAYTVFSMEHITQATETVEIKQTTDFQKTTEEFEIIKVQKVNEQFNMTVSNTGDMPLHLTRLWVENTTDSTWPISKYDIDVVISPGYSATNVGQNIGLAALDTQSYQMKLVSERGNSEKTSLNSVNNDSVYLNLRATPTQISTGFSSTLVLEVINTGTNKLVNLQAEMDSVVENCVSCTYDAVSGPSPTSFDSLNPGDIAIFEWVYTVDGTTDGDNLTFTASLVDGVDTDTAVVSIKVVEIAEVVNVALQSNGFGTEAKIPKNLLMLHAEQTHVPNGGYQLMSVEPDGGNDGTRLPTGGSGSGTVVYDNSADNSGALCNSTSCSVNLNIADQNNMMILVVSSDEDSTRRLVTSVDEETNTDVGIIVSDQYVEIQSLYVHRIMDEDITNKGGTNTITVNYASAPSGGGISVHSFYDVNQDTPDDIDTNEQESDGSSLSVVSTPLEDNSLIFTAGGSGEPNSCTSYGSGQTERADFETTSSRQCVTTEILSTAAADTQTHNVSFNRYAISASAYAPAYTISLDPFPAPLSFMTSNGSSAVTVPAGTWNATLWIDGAENPLTDVSGPIPDIKYHMEDGDGVNPDNSRTSSTGSNLEHCSVSTAWCNISAAICNDDWDNRFAITVDNAQVSGNSNLSDFPMLVHITGTDFTNYLDDADDSINDIRFTSDAGVLLDYEIEKYGKTTNQLIAWVEIPTLDYNDDTIIYMYFDNAETSGYGDEQDASGTWSSDYVAVYHMNGTGNIVDSTGNGHTGTNTGSTSTSSGVVGDARSFDGINDYIRVASHADFNNLDAMSIEIWVNADNTVDKPISRWDFGNQAQGFGLSNSYWYVVDGDWVAGQDDAGRLSDSAWHKYTMKRGSGTSEVHSFRDKTNIANTSAITVDNNISDPMDIGKDNRSSSAYIDALIDEIRISSVERTDDWLETTYNTQNSPSTFYSLTVQSTGGGNHPDWQAGQGPHGSGAYYYDGVSSCHRTVGDVSSGNANDIAGNDAATSLWFQTDGTVPVSTEQMLVYYEGAGTYPNTDYYKISLVEEGKVLYEFDANQGSGTTTCKSTLDTYDDGAWYNVIGVRDESDDSCDLYIYDITGTLKPGESVITGTQTGSGNVINVDAGDKMYVGSRVEAADYFKGWIDDVFHWNTVELDSTDAQALARVNHGTAAHKFDVFIDVHDSSGNWLRNEYTSLTEILPYHDPKHYNQATDDNAVGMYNITMTSVPQITLTSAERLNFTMAFQESSGTWQDMRMGLKIDDVTLSPRPSYLQIPEPDNAFGSYLRYDKTDPVELLIENVGTDGIYYVYSGTRVSFENGTNSYASLIDSVNGTSPSSWTLNMTKDSLYIPPGEIAHMYFYEEPSDHPCQDTGTQCISGNPQAVIIPDGYYTIAAWINGYTNMGESFGRSVILGSVDVS